MPIKTVSLFLFVWRCNIYVELNVLKKTNTLNHNQINMKKSIIVALLLIISIGAGIAAITGIDGKWAGPLHTPDDNTTEVEYNFTTSGNKITGKTESVFGSAIIENAKLEGDNLTFNINMNGLDLPHKAKIYADSISMNIDYKGMPLHVTLKRKAN